MDIRSTFAPTGTLRASINLGNPVLAQGTPEVPSGVTIDIAKELAARLDLPVEFLCFGAARESFEAMKAGKADLCFLAVDPARESSVAFTAPYVLIQGVFAVPIDSPVSTAEAVDREGVRVGVKDGSAYDLFLSRTLVHAQVVRGEEGVTVFLEQHLEVAAGIRQPMEDFIRSQGGMRLLEPHFMEIKQAVGIPPSRGHDTIRFLQEFVEELKSNGFIAEALRRSGRTDATVALPSVSSS
ncbi:transporter substrate-binding domain-containing protein [Ferrimicrobium sp.]|uniref:transporter substrate-binding domain-containing protein n=1 Tax=Ferrimicrobium sp. TaxID=2926050 RepID=UPI00260E244D|nr:transporter substrate-binding domain-containing protein [Ferrimicrobium sp.]